MFSAQLSGLYSALELNAISSPDHLHPTSGVFSHFNIFVDGYFETEIVSSWLLSSKYFFDLKLVQNICKPCGKLSYLHQAF